MVLLGTRRGGAGHLSALSTSFECSEVQAPQRPKARLLDFSDSLEERETVMKLSLDFDRCTLVFWNSPREGNPVMLPPLSGS